MRTIAWALLVFAVGACGAVGSTAPSPASAVAEPPPATGAPGAPVPVVGQPVTPAPEQPRAENQRDFAREKRPLEIEIAYPLSISGDMGSATSLHIQPMLFWNRRINLGTRFIINPVIGEEAFDSFELAAYLGYQHYVSRALVPYWRIIAGAYSEDSAEADAEDEDESKLDLGGEVGVKLYTSRGFHFSIATGASTERKTYASAGFGLGLNMRGGGGGNPLGIAVFIPVVVGIAAALLPWGIDKAVN